MDSFSFAATVWRHSGQGGWHFVTLPEDVAEAIRFFRPAKGFTPIAVAAEIGGTRWKTSVFPDSKSRSYLLALKADVRKAEKIGHGDTVSVRLSLIG